MSDPYDLITITKSDLSRYERASTNNKISLIINLILSELPEKLKGKSKFIEPTLKPIPGFEDQYIKGYEVCICQNFRIEQFVRRYLPFFILRKDST